MPYGIPPSDPTILAAADYESATTDELQSVANTIVAPLSVQAELYDDSLKDIVKQLVKSLKKTGKSIDSEVDAMASQLTDALDAYGSFVNSSVGQAEQQCDECGEPISCAPTATQFVSTPIVPENYSVGKPPAPSPGVNFQCPPAPADWTLNKGVIGTAEWCVDLEKIVGLLDTIGSYVVTWLQSAITPDAWEQWVRDNVKLWDSPSWVKSLGDGIVSGIATFVRMAAGGVLVLTDLIRCALYYSRVFTPIRNPGAYTALLFLRNAIQWVHDSKVGSQSYLGFTINTSLRLPQLEQWIERLLDYLCCTELPGIPDAMDMHIRGVISYDQYECLLRLQGADPRLWNKVVEARGVYPTLTEMIEYWRRTGLEGNARVDLARKAGITDDSMLKIFNTLYDELPTVQDHLHWLQKNVFDMEYVQKYKLMDGFEERFWKAYGSQLEAQGYTKERAANEYAAHWIMPSPTQLREFVYRLRPGRDKQGVQFTVDDFSRILAEQDYNISARAWEAATVYKVPALTYLRDMHRMDIISDEAMREYHADLGYTPEDSDLFVRVDTFRKRRMRATQGSGWSPAALRKGVAVGQVTTAFVSERMEAMGYTAADTTDLIARAKSDLQYRVLSRSISTELTSTILQVKNAQRTGVMAETDAASSLVSLGFPPERAKAIAAITTASIKTELVRHAVQHLRRAFADGEITEQPCRQLLSQLGIVQDATDRYITTWRIEQTPGRRRRTAKQIANDVAEGQLDIDEATARLHNLGYADAEAQLYLADAARATVTTEAALVAAQGLPGRAHSQRLAQLGQQTIGLSKRIVAQLMRQESPGKLRKWALADIVDEPYVRKRLSLYGWPDDSIDKWIAEIKANGGWPEEAETSEP